MKRDINVIKTFAYECGINKTLGSLLKKKDSFLFIHFEENIPMTANRKFVCNYPVQ
jgi:hypothetical protein